jgi:uncharacterized protein YndB with AHSA1/START domain
MATSSLSPDGDALVSEIQIAAAPEEVFRALTDPTLVVQWWGGQGAGQSFRCTHYESDLRPGGRWRSIGVDAQGRPFEAAGAYVEIDPPRLLVQTWVASWTAAVETTVRWELEATSGGTLLRHRHCGLAAHPETGRSFRGWPRILGWLQAFMEKGETVEARWGIAER